MPWVNGRWYEPGTEPKVDSYGIPIPSSDPVTGAQNAAGIPTSPPNEVARAQEAAGLPTSSDPVLEATQPSQGGDLWSWISGIGKTLGSTPLVINPDAPGGSLDTTLADERRGRSAGLADYLQGQANTGGGAWEQTFADAVRRSKNTASALAQSNPNQGYQSSLRNMGNAQAAADQRAVGQEDILRTQAKLGAQDRLAPMLGQMNQQDISQAADAAAVRQARRQANQQLVSQAKENAHGIENAISQAIPLFGSDGGRVPGQPEVFGDDERNDTVPAWLSPGEIVIPRSIATSPEAAERSADFVRAIKKQRQPPRSARGFADGGDTGVSYHPAGDKPPDFGTFLTTMIAPSIGIENMYKQLGDGPQTPSIENGAWLDYGQYADSRGRMDAAQDMYDQRALGKGPSVVGQQLQNSNDANIAAAMQGAASNPRGASAAAAGNAIMQAVSGQQDDAASAAAARMGEQFAGQDMAARAAAEQRQRDQAMALGQQQAAWKNTMMNAGLTLEGQSLVQGLSSGAGQALAAYSGMGKGKGKNDLDLGEGETASSGWYDQPAGPEYRPDEMARGGQVRGLSGFAEAVKRKQPVKAWRGAMFNQAPPAALPARRDAGPVTYSFSLPGAPAAVPPPAAPPVSVPPPTSDMGPKPTYEVILPPEEKPRDFRLPGSKISRSMIESARSAGVPIATSSPNPVHDMTKTTVPTGEQAEDGTPVGKSVDAIMVPSIPGLRPKQAPTEEKPPVEAPKPKTSGVGGGAAMPADKSPGEFAEGIRQQQEALRMKGEAEAEQARATAVALGEQEKQLQANAIEQKAIRERAKLQTDEAMARVKASRDDMARVDTTVDPGRFWASRTTAQKITGIIGLALGSIGGAKDGINRAAMLLNQAIDRDLDAQKSEVAARLKKGQASVEAATSAYGLARQAMGDDLAASDAARASLLELTNAKVKQIAATAASPIAKANAMALSGQLEAEIGKFDQQAYNNAFDRKHKNELVGIQRQHMANETAKLGAQGLDKDTQKQVLEIEEREREIQQSGKKLLGLIDKYGTGEKIEPGVEAEMEQAINGMIIASAKMQDREGVVRDADEERERRSMGFEPGFFQRGASAKKAIQSYIDNAARRRGNAFAVRGLR